MGNKKKVGTKRSVFKKRKNIGKPNPEVVTPSTSQNLDQSTKASCSKVKLDKSFSYYESKNETFTYDIIDVDMFNKILTEVAVCKFCHKSLQFTKKPVAGLATKFRIYCADCQKTDKSFLNCKEIKHTIPGECKTKTLYDLNIRLVYGLRVIGKGYTAAQSLCGILNISPPPTQYSSYEKALGQIAEELCEKSMKVAAVEAVARNNKITDLCVAVDGSWQKRGHVSLNGIVSVTSVDTGKVLDIHAMSK